MTPTTLLQALKRGFGTVVELVEGNAGSSPDKIALIQSDQSVTYSQLVSLIDGVAFAMQRAGISPKTPVAILSGTTIESVITFLGILRAGCIPALISTTATRAQIRAMIEDCGASCVMADPEGVALIGNCDQIVLPVGRAEAVAKARDKLRPFEAKAEDPFNIIYSSGTTGRPKGIVQSHGMRWAQIVSYSAAGFGDAVTMVATPLYSNTTLVSLLSTLALGGTAILLGKFDAHEFLEMSQRWRATHTMLVPIQFQRILAVPEFKTYDLSSFRVKTSTGAHFPADLKRDVLLRWPGMLIEFYGMTEGGGTTMLFANAFPHKLHTVGQPVPNCDIRIINDEGIELPRGEIGEIVGRSRAMMQGYHRRNDDTEATNWFSPEGERFIRHGDIGRLDEDGFLVLLGRAKDLIISGGFNVYPSDLEAVLCEHPAVTDAAVIGIPCDKWGETPYAFCVCESNTATSKDLLDFVNRRLGRTQQISGLEIIAELPRNPLGKVLKRELRYLHDATAKLPSTPERSALC